MRRPRGFQLPTMLFAVLSLVAADGGVAGAVSAVDPVRYVVRPDGGDATQCSGRVDAPYPGTGAGLDCAWAHPFWALDAEGRWRIAGGDTLQIHPGSYRMGVGAPNTGWCDADAAYDCHLPPLPSGPDATRPTRLVGAGWGAGCPRMPELWGAEGASSVIDLRGTSHARIACLEITDHSGCVEDHADRAVRCHRDEPPYGDWAFAGIRAEDAADVVLRDLDVHGLASHGVWAGRLRDWTVERVRLAANGWVGWDGDVGDSASTGRLAFRAWLVEWNGCAESYPERAPYACWSQSAGGWGDGVGMHTTGGRWVIEDSVFRYNTSDGLDLLYVRLDPSSIEIRRTLAYGNAGDQIKVNGPARIENVVAVSHCAFFEGAPFSYDVDPCRAGGSALALTLRPGSRVSVTNATIAGEGDCLVLVECEPAGSCTGDATLSVWNGVFIGHPEHGDPADVAAYLFFHPEPFGRVDTGHNLVHGAKLSNVPLGASDRMLDPRVVDGSLAAFDGHLQADSPAIDAGMPVGDPLGLVPDHDLEGRPRPRGAGVDAGAYER
jgi:hypothetical protein